MFLMAIVIMVFPWMLKLVLSCAVGGPLSPLAGDRPYCGALGDDGCLIA